MAFIDATIASAIKGGAGLFDWTRTVDGTMYAVRYDDTLSPKRGLGYISLDEGKTWSAESWSNSIGSATGDGCRDVQAMSAPPSLLHPGGSVWLAMGGFDGTDNPVVIQRDPVRELWGGPGIFFVGYAVLTTKTGVTYFKAAMDSSTTTAAAWNIGAVFVHSGTLYYRDLLAVADVSISATGTITDAQLAITGGGTKNAAWLESGKVWSSQQDATTGSWSSRVRVSLPHHVVSSVEAVTIAPNEQPTVLYIADSGFVSTLELWMAEFDSATSTWLTTQISEGGNAYDFFPGCSIGYDARGTVYVAAMYDVNALGRAEVCEFNLPRGVTPATTTWTFFVRTALSGGDAATCRVLAERTTPSLYGHTPTRPDRGMVYAAFEWPNGAAATAQNLHFYNPDDESAPGSAYTTNFPPLSGEPPFREAPETTGLPSVSLAGEGTALLDFPDVEAEFGRIQIAAAFVTHVHTFQTGLRYRVSKLPSDRAVIDLEFLDVQNAEFGGVKTFIDARKKDKAPFNWTDTKEAEVYEVQVLTNKVRRERLDGRPDDGAYVLAVQLQETR